MLKALAVCCLGVVASLSAGGVSAQAATLIQTRGFVPTLRLANYDPIPANGVLTFSYAEGMTVHIFAADGSEVLGSFVEPGIWRPDEPFAVGTYTADVEFEPAPGRAEDGSFDVVAAVDVLPELVRVSITSQVAIAGVLEEVCCEGGEARVDGQACVSDCKPLCVPTSYATKQTVDVLYAFDGENQLAMQVRVNRPTTLGPGQFAEGSWDVLDDAQAGPPERLCGVAEIFSWLDETTTTVTDCIDNSEPDLTPVRDAVTAFGHITECTEPPEGYEAAWCRAQVYTCENEVITLSGADSQSLFAACETYYSLCNRPKPEPNHPGQQPDSSFGQADTPSNDNEAGNGNHADVEQRGVGDSASACALQTSGSGAGSSHRPLYYAVAALFALVAAAFMRRHGSWTLKRRATTSARP